SASASVAGGTFTPWRASASLTRDQFGKTRTPPASRNTVWMCTTSAYTCIHAGRLYCGIKSDNTLLSSFVIGPRQKRPGILSEETFRQMNPRRAFVVVIALGAVALVY